MPGWLRQLRSRTPVPGSRLIDGARHLSTRDDTRRYAGCAPGVAVHLGPHGRADTESDRAADPRMNPQRK